MFKRSHKLTLRVLVIRHVKRSRLCRTPCGNNSFQVHRVFDCQTWGLERRIREGDSMGFYAHLKGASLETSRKCNSQFIRDEQGSCWGTRRKSSNDGRGPSRRFSKTHPQFSTPRSYIACRNTKSAMPWVNHQRVKTLYLHWDEWPTRR